ncbi:MAG: family 10 glycosylhydrolase [Planctomycetes bacterium]|nr:family 10 glycosylhydrolase [Planctomycetota bacterium]MBI3835696.1 family 10 glycosylhydrolase [Planctomycetota bacterium]
MKSSCAVRLMLRHWRRSILLTLTALTVSTSSGCIGGRWSLWGKKYGSEPIRAIWVTRWDYKTPQDIARVMDNCQRAGFNTVLFQVRGNGTASYRSHIEPWAEEFGGHDPGYDPLAVACKEAHKHGMALHAWVNVIPGWRGNKVPHDPRQLYNAHPDWFWRDANGQRQPLGWYCSVNPCYPEVRRYLAAVMSEIARYPVDGIHMDYIRFPNEWNESFPKGAAVPDYPRDPRTLAMFYRATHRTPEQAPGVWIAWRSDQVTQTVRDIRSAIRRENSSIVLSAAVGASPDDARRLHFQDSRQWIKEGLVDAVFPMNYEQDMGVYTRRLQNWSGYQSEVAVVPGIMFDKRDAEKVLAQVHRTSQTGSHFAAFAYNSIFERTDGSGHLITDGQSPSRAELRRRIIPYLRSRAS